MPDASLCPSPMTLQRFLLGQVSSVEADLLEQHVERCALCQQSLEGLDLPDRLLQAARIAGTKPRTTRPPALENLLRRLSGLSAIISGEGVATGGGGGWAGTVDIQPLLAPPQGPGEIGRLGPYRVLDVLGAGGMGVVFRAEDLQLGRLVALKVLRPRLAESATARQRLLREARTAAAIEHDHILPIYQVGEDRGVPFLAFPILKGETLEARLKREGRLPLVEVLRIGREIAEGLAAAHGRGLVHRDIKPGNIWLEERPLPAASRVKILDFGLARPVAEVQEIQAEEGAVRSGATITHLGAIVGTPAYMAPEQAWGGPVEARADLFSLGAVLYRMATGGVPFTGADDLAVLAAVQRDQPAPPRSFKPRVPPRLSKLILELMAKKASERPSSARAVAERLAAMAASRRRRWWIVAGAGLLAALVLLAAYLVRSTGNDGNLNGLSQETDEPIAGIEFVEAGSYQAGLNPCRMAVGDLNGDGKLDLVVVNQGIRSPNIEEHTGGDVSVFLGKGDGTFPKAVNYPVGLYPAAIQVADFNGDRKPDLVVTNMSSHNISVFLGKGDGTFPKALSYPAGRHPFHLVAADFNGDGQLDLAVVNLFHQGGVCLLLGNGDGSFPAPTFYATGINSGWTTAGDFTGRGRLDLVVSNITSNTLSFLRNNGNGTFQPARHHYLDQPTLVGTVDFDGDGQLDLAVNAGRTPRLQLLLGRGDGSFRDGPLLKGAYPTVLADFNGDNRADLVSLEPLSPGEGQLHLHLGKGRGAFLSSQPKNFHFRPYQMVAGDFNGDGRPDLAVSLDRLSQVKVLLNQSVVERLTVSCQEFEAGKPTFVLITAQDATGAPALGYTGTVRLTCDGEQKGLPAEYKFTIEDKGTHPFIPVIFAKPVRHTITVTDAANPHLHGSGIMDVYRPHP